MKNSQERSHVLYNLLTCIRRLQGSVLILRLCILQSLLLRKVKVSCLLGPTQDQCDSIEDSLQDNASTMSDLLLDVLPTLCMYASYMIQERGLLLKVRKDNSVSLSKCFKDILDL